MNDPVTIFICMGSSCFARGNRNNLTLIENFLEKHNLTAAVRLEGSHCDAECQKGPNIRIGDTLYQHVDPGMLLDILETHFAVNAKE